MAQSLQILDVTIRDGSFVINFQYTPEQVANIVGALDRSGIPYIEIAHGMGLGAAENVGAPAGATDLEYIRAARQKVRRAKLGAIAVPFHTTNEKNILQMLGLLDFVRIVAYADDVRPSLKMASLARRNGFDVFFQMIRSARVSPQRLLDQAKRVEGAGARVVYVVDTAGYYLPQDVARVVQLLKNKLSIQVGFHGHDNLNLGVANALAAVKAGVDFVDASLRGFGRGAGNTKLESLVVLLQRQGLLRHIKLDVLLDAAERYVDPLTPHDRGKGNADLLTAASNVDLFPLSFGEQLASALNVPFARLVRTLGKNVHSAQQSRSEWKQVIRLLGGQPHRLLPSQSRKIQRRQKKCEALLAIDIPIEGLCFPNSAREYLSQRFPQLRFRVDFMSEIHAQAVKGVEIMWAHHISPEVLQQATSLTWFHGYSGGIDHLPLRLFEKQGVMVTFPRGVMAPTVAETVIGSILLFYRKIYESVLSQLSNSWKTKEILELHPPLRELRGSTVGIIGLGSIGLEVARRCKQLGSRVIGLEVIKGFTSSWVDEVFPPRALSSLLAKSDAIVLACPLTQETHHLIGRHEFRRMRPHAILINVARGSLVNEAALMEALEQGRIAGALFDAFTVEPLPDNHPLFQTPCFVVMPHISGFAQHTWQRLFECFIKNLSCYFEGRPLPDAVDLKRGY
ncbi:MAG: hypothetical protein HY465_01320 [Deltaproteobacteria bacterium]|nr:hypothetical protein [Deltaproteobacteria bacterium]